VGYVPAAVLNLTLRTAGIATLLRRALGSSVLALLLDRVAALAEVAEDGGGSGTGTGTDTGTTLTWGEFLLLLLPGAPSGAGYARSALTPAERLGVSTAVPGVWSDEMWSLVPLEMESGADGTGNAGSRREYARLDASALRKEVSRLACERAYLLKKLSGSAHSMGR